MPSRTWRGVATSGKEVRPGGAVIVPSMQTDCKRTTPDWADLTALSITTPALETSD